MPSKPGDILCKKCGKIRHLKQVRIGKQSDFCWRCANKIYFEKRGSKSKVFPGTKKCSTCGVVRTLKDVNRANSEVCRTCGVRAAMPERSKNIKWKERLSEASIGKPKSEAHKQALRKPKKIYTRKMKMINYGNSWSINRRLALERDGRRCRTCGTIYKLEVHHLNPFRKSKNNNLNNLITQCARCHRRAEECRRPRNNNTCGVVLAGGRGTRLSPITVFHNKHELPMGAIPMIFHPLKTLRELRITKVLVILNKEKVGRIIEMLGDGGEFGLEISYRIQNGSGGIAEALLLAEDFVKGRDMYVILGDNIFSEKEFSKSPKMYTEGLVFLKRVNNPKDYGVAEIKNNRVISVVEKPQKPSTDMAVTGLYGYKPTIFNILKTLSPSERGELEISQLNDILAKRGELAYKTIRGMWLDAGGSHEGYIKAQMYCLKTWVDKLST